MDRRVEPYKRAGTTSYGFCVGYHDQNDRSGAGQCRRCNVIMRLRIGIRVPGFLRPKWYHPECFWKTMSEGVDRISTKCIEGIDQISFEDQVRIIEDIHKYETSPHLRNIPLGKELFRITNKPATSVMRVQQPTSVLFLNKIRVMTMHVPRGNCQECSVEFVPCEVVVSVDQEKVHMLCAYVGTTFQVGSLEMVEGYRSLDKNSAALFQESYEARKQAMKEEKLAVHLKSFRKEDNSCIVLSNITANSWQKGYMLCSYCRTQLLPGQLTFSLNFADAHAHCVLRDAIVVIDPLQSIANWNELTDEVRKKLTLLYTIASLSPTTRAASHIRVPEDRAVPAPGVVQHISKIMRDFTTSKVDLKNPEQKRQVTVMCNLRSAFQTLTDADFEIILKHNNQEVPEDRDEKIERLVDIFMFGSPKRCQKCNGIVNFHTSLRKYKCNNWATPFSKCDFKSKNPPRTSFEIPDKYWNVFETLLYDINQHKTRYYASTMETISETTKKMTKKVVLPSEVLGTRLSAGKVMEAVNSPHYKTGYFRKQGSAVPVIFPQANDYHVMRTDENEAYEAFLTDVEVQHNRNSAIQLFLMKHDHGMKFVVFKVFSRIGTKLIEHESTPFDMCDEAVKYFNDEFYKATGGKWDRKEAVDSKQPGKYFWVRIAHEPIFDPQSLTVPNEFLPPRFHTDHQGMGHIDHEMKEFARKSLQYLKQKISARTATNWDYIDTTNRVFSAFPTNNGFENHHLINSYQRISAVITLLDVAEPQFFPERLHPSIDLQLTHKANQSLRYLNRDSEDWQIIDAYFRASQSLGHRCYNAAEILEIYTVNRVDHVPAKYPGKPMLLWHGTRKENISSILERGLLTDPGHAARHGKMFGNGIYFADAFVKSYGYANRERGDAYLFLCEVAVGKVFENTTAMGERAILATLQSEEYDSIKGVGKWAPETKHDKTWKDMIVFLGKLNTNRTNAAGLNYNEYIVYEEDRVTLRYLVKVKTDGKGSL
ncbi:unnamed protein product [Caenorhabditis sp. 36 PRJEB53466]|nr:unnamed protein product [Caenorhabditis sp. 36 PRJEB53466]